ncbi:MAG: hypothetical protein HYS13_07000 [Planctomycetia bacterium]|nr:hypothetical protein [Planctomycetia bacterium]
MENASVLDRLLDPLGSLLTPEVARRVADFRADAETGRRIEDLAEKANEGTLTEKDRREYDTYIAAIDFITVLQAKARTKLKQRP